VTNWSPSANCRCCGTSLAGAFCSGCGQRADTRRLASQELLARLVGALVSLEGPLLHTAFGLLVRPGAVVAEYLRGKRVVYTNPVQWSLLTTGLAALVSHLLGWVGPVRVRLDGDEPPWLRTALEQLGSNTGPLLVLGLLPCLAVAMRICFLRSSLTIAEHLVHVLYCYGTGALLQVVWAGAVAGFGAPAQPAGILPLVWMAWAAPAVHATRHPAVAVLGIVAAHLVWMLVLALLGLLAFAVCWITGLVDR
jgi:hypothetical protein